MKKGDWISAFGDIVYRTLPNTKLQVFITYLYEARKEDSFFAITLEWYVFFSKTWLTPSIRLGVELSHLRKVLILSGRVSRWMKGRVLYAIVEKSCNTQVFLEGLQRDIHEIASRLAAEEVVDIPFNLLYELIAAYVGLTCRPEERYCEHLLWNKQPTSERLGRWWDGMFPSGRFPLRF